jgi:glycosyltransferase involved in cell wall biosynthesis
MATYLLSALPFALKLVRQQGYELNHTHFIFPDGFVAYWLKRLTGLPYIITAHGSDVPGYNPQRFKAMHVVLRPAWRKILHAAEVVISPSASLANLIQAQEAGTSVKIIPNGVEPMKLDFHQHQPERILVATRMFERKGVQYVLQALAGWEHTYRLDIIGEGPYLQKLKDLANEIPLRGEVFFHGWLEHDDPRFHDLFEKAGIFVLPSESENFPIALLEAMSAGLAIITTRGTGCEEVVADTGILVNPNDAGAIREALRNLLLQPELVRKLGQKAYQRVRQEFGWPAVASRYLKVYQEVLQTSKP